MDAKIGPEQVERAVAGINRATTKLINLLKSPDEEVRAGTSAALLALDPPPVLAMITSLFKARDTNFKIEIIKILSGLGEEFRTPVVLATSQLWQGCDPAVGRAIVDAVLVMGPAPVEPRPTPAKSIATTPPCRHDTGRAES